MAEVTAGMVKQLRDKTDAPMMECKKALAEAGGEMERAEEILRIKLGNRASGRVELDQRIPMFSLKERKHRNTNKREVPC